MAEIEPSILVWSFYFFLHNIVCGVTLQKIVFSYQKKYFTDETTNRMDVPLIEQERQRKEI